MSSSDDKDQTLRAEVPVIPTLPHLLPPLWRPSLCVSQKMAEEAEAPSLLEPQAAKSVTETRAGHHGLQSGDRASTRQHLTEFTSVQLLNCVQRFATPWITAHQASLSIINTSSLLKLMSTESMMPSNHLILCHPLLLPSIFPSIRVFSNELVLCIRWPKYWNFSIRSSDDFQDWFPLGFTGLISLHPKGLSRVFSNITVQKHQFFRTQLSLESNFHIHTWLLEKP